MKTSAFLLLLAVLLAASPSPVFCQETPTGEAVRHDTAETDASPAPVDDKFGDLFGRSDDTAREPPAPPADAGPAPPTDGASFLRLLGKMIAATAVAALLVVLLARFLNRARAWSAHGHIRVLDRAPLGGGRMVHLVKVHGKLIVVGSAGDSIAPLSEFTDPAEIQAVLLSYDYGATGRSFREHVEERGGFAPAPPPDGEEA